jgi:hypothetical protein
VEIIVNQIRQEVWRELVWVGAVTDVLVSGISFLCDLFEGSRLQNLATPVREGT